MTVPIEISSYQTGTEKDVNGLHEIESLEFVYQKIQWTWTDGGVTAEDDWSAPAE